MNVMVVGLLAIAAYFVVVAVWIKRQDRGNATGETSPPEQRGTS